MSKKSYSDQCLERAEKATEGPWNFTYDGSSDYSIGPGDPQENRAIGIWSQKEGTFENIEFIAHARTDVPELARRLKKACDELRNAADTIALYQTNGATFYSRVADELERMPEEEEEEE